MFLDGERAKSYVVQTSTQLIDRYASVTQQARNLARKVDQRCRLVARERIIAWVVVQDGRNDAAKDA